MGLESLNDIFFTSAAHTELTYDQILEDVQKYCTENTQTSFPQRAIRGRQESS